MNDCKWAKTCCYDVCAPDYCPEYEEAVLTNGDRIRAMTDVELARLLLHFVEDCAIVNGYKKPEWADGIEEKLVGMIQEPAEVE